MPDNILELCDISRALFTVTSPSEPYLPKSFTTKYAPQMRVSGSVRK